jgi:hypothetical protein
MARLVWARAAKGNMGRACSVAIGALLLLSLMSSVAAAKDGLSPSERRALANVKIAPYSENPPADRPYRACPPPTATRPSCDTIVVPEGAQEILAPTEGGDNLPGKSPAELQDAYNLSTTAGEGVVVAVVAWNFPTSSAENDLAKYRSTYGLPPCTTANGCFKEVVLPNAIESPGPEATESALGPQMVSAACPKCKILLIQTGGWHTDLAEANQVAIGMGADVIYNAWYLSNGEENQEALHSELDPYLSHPADVTIVAAAGNAPKPTYPGTSTKVVTVGGTHLTKATNSRGWEEHAWAGAGSGCSLFQAKPAWQVDPGCEHRAVADVAAVADPFSPVSIYSGSNGGWIGVGGTSAASPLIAGYIATKSLAFREAAPKSFYDAARNHEMYDVVFGLNKNCNPGSNGYPESYLCEGSPGYDGPTGVGTPGTPLPGPPADWRQPALLEPESVMLKGAINPQGKATTYQFEYGTTTAYGASVPAIPASAGSGIEAVLVSQRLTGLSPGTKYHYRLAATNSTGTYYDLGSFFTTLTAAQFEVSTESATGVGVQTATLNGAIEPAGAETTYQFEYGPTTAYGSLSPAAPKTVGPGFATVSQTLTGLESARVYHFRVKATQGSEVKYGRDYVLRTPPGPPTAITFPPSVVSNITARMNGRVSAGGAEATYGFQILSEAEFKEKGFPSKLPSGVGSAISGSDLTDVNRSSGGVSEEETYYYRLIAENPHGVAYGQVQSFTTLGWRDENVFNPPSSWKAALNGVSCFSATACTAVGTNTSQSPATTLAVGKTSNWKVQVTPNPVGATESRLEDVSCPTASFCMAVGSYLNGAGVRQPLAERWNGTEWAIAPTPLPAGATGGQLEGVSCSSPASCTAVGSYVAGSGANLPLAEQWGSEAWSAEAPPVPAGAGKALLHDVSCAGSECWAVGESEEAGKGSTALVERRTSGGWAVQALSEPVKALTSISCASSSWCAAVGSGLHVQHWNGTGWSDRLAPNPGGESGQLTGVSCTSATSCTAVGTYDPGHPVPFAEHWGGAEWQLRGMTDMEFPGCTGPSCPVGSAIADVACVPGWCSAVGSKTAKSGTVTPLIERHLAPKPRVDYGLPTVDPASVTLRGTVDPRGEDTAYRFEYDTVEYKAGEAPHGSSIPVSPQALGSRFGTVAVSQQLGRPSQPGTYHYRLVAESAAGTTYGADRTFEVHAPRFQAAQYPATLSGGQAASYSNVLETEGGTVECGKATVSGQLSAVSDTLALSPTYSECKGFGFASASVATNGCIYQLELEGTRFGSDYPATVGVACPEGKSIEITANNCTVSIGAQSGLGPAATSTDPANPRRVEVEFNLVNLKYTVTKDGFACPFSGTGAKQNGAYSGPMTVSGANASQAPIDVEVAGVEVESHPPRFESAGYPSTLTGGQNLAYNMFVLQAGSVECGKATVSGQLAAASDTITLSPTYSECKAFGFSSATVATNGCTYTVALAGTKSGNEYPGSMGISCPVGKAIEVTAGNCTAAIGAQSSLSSLAAVNDTVSTPQRAEVKFSVKNLKYTVIKDGFACPFSGTGAKEGGAYNGPTTIKAVSRPTGKAAQLGLRVGE